MPTFTSRRAGYGAALLAVAAVAALTVSGASAELPTKAPAAQGFGLGDRPVTMTPIGTYATGQFNKGAAEIPAYDPWTRRLFVVNAQTGTIDVLDIQNPKQPTKIGELPAPGANSVSVHRGLVAVASQAAVKTDPGSVLFFDARSLTARGSVTVGALPDMITFTNNGRYALVANEGEPNHYCTDPAQVAANGPSVDPEGSVSIIDLRRGPDRATVRTAGFADYNGSAADLKAEGVRIYGPGATVAQDLEPEYIAVSSNDRFAKVTLQENNAIATLDIRSGEFIDIQPLGLKDHSAPANALDASDKDGAINVKNWPVKGMYQPDSIASFNTRGRDYYISANEGDARDYKCFNEETSVKKAPLDPAAFANAADLKQDANLGRLTITNTAPTSAAGMTELHAFGGRSVSIHDQFGRMVFDSGDQLERAIAQATPELFNANHDEANSFDKRSDNKGPEPEGLAVGTVHGRTIAFVGLERPSHIAAFDVTDPRTARIVGLAHNRITTGDPKLGTAGDLGPEGLTFIDARNSPTRKPLLVVGNEISGTTTIWQLS